MAVGIFLGMGLVIMLFICIGLEVNNFTLKETFKQKLKELHSEGYFQNDFKNLSKKEQSLWRILNTEDFNYAWSPFIYEVEKTTSKLFHLKANADLYRICANKTTLEHMLGEEFFESLLIVHILNILYNDPTKSSTSIQKQGQEMLLLFKHPTMRTNITNREIRVCEHWIRKQK